MAVTFDAVGPSSAGQSTGTSPNSWTHTAVASGVALVVGVSVGHTAGSDGTIAVTCDGTSMTQLGLQDSAATNVGFAALFGIANQASGAHSISVTYSGGASFDSINAGSVSYAGASTSSPFGTAQLAHDTTGGAANPSITFTGSTSGNMVTAVACDGGGSMSAMSAGTFRWGTTANSGASGASNAAGGDIAGGGSVTLTFTQASVDLWGVVAVEVQVTGAGTSGPPLSPEFMQRPPAVIVSRAGWRGAQHSQ